MFRFRDILVAKLGNEKSEQFAEWAFGKDFHDMHLDDFMDSWNALHGDKLMLCGSSKVVDDISKMIEIWESQ